MKKAVITILGIQGGFVEDNKVIFTGKGFDFKAKYYFQGEEEKEYFNTLPLLIDRYSHKNYEIIPLYTTDAKIFNEEVLKRSNKTVNFPEKYHIKDEKKFKEIFALFNETIDEYDEIIIDLTHGFRHLPLLMLVDLLIQNFKNTQKVKQILFAMEVEKHLPNLKDKEQRGLYEFIDLKEYLELSNIAFILSTFNENYTVANHIQTQKFTPLISALNSVSNDIMALNLNNLFDNSIPSLLKELNNITDVSIKKEADKLSKNLKETFKKKDKRYLTYYELCIELCEKNYMLLSLSLLYESIRLYIKTTIKKDNKSIVEKIEIGYNQDLYKIGDFFIKLKNDSMNYEKFKKNWQSDYKTKSKEIPINKDEFDTLKKSFPIKLLEKIPKNRKSSKPKTSLINLVAEKRNNLAHANSSTVSFKDIKDDIKYLINKFQESCIKKSDVSDLKNFFG